MDIRKVDNKGRITAGKKGEHYYVEHTEGGTVILHPVPQIKIAAFSETAREQIMESLRKGLATNGGRY